MAETRQQQRKECGQIVIISSPSGGGKTSICRALLTPERKRRGWRFSISYTTRKKRPGERNGREYYFVDEQKFERLIKADFFAEHFQVHLYHYGTPREPLKDVVSRGGVMLLDVDVKGALALKQEFPDALTIFILPPSFAALKSRLKKRGTETEEQLRVRRENARKEINRYKNFSHVVVNDDLEAAVEKVLSIITAQACQTEFFDEEQFRTLFVKRGA